MTATDNGRSLTGRWGPFRQVAGDFNCWGRHGRGWRFLGVYRAMTDLAAARHAFKSTGYRRIRVEYADFYTEPPSFYRFQKAK